MSLKKNLLAASVGALLLAGAAQAQVDFEFPQSSNDAIVVARELKNNQTLSPAGAQDPVDDLVWTIGYNFSPGEVRYGSLKCTSNVTLGSPVITVNDPDAGGPDITLGAVNGAGTDTLFFSMTAASPSFGGDTITSDIELVVDANITLLDKNPVRCRFGIYDTPSQAQLAGDIGVPGTIFTTGFQDYILRADSYVFSVTPGQDTADVEASPAYTAFVTPSAATGDFNSNVRLALVTTPPLNKQLLPIALTDLFSGVAPNPTRIVVQGDNSAATDIELNGNASDTTGTNQHTYVFGSALPNTGVNGPLVYLPNGTDEIQISNYTAQFVPKFTTDYELMQVHSALNAGDINRNGTELVAPLAQIPSGWLSRLVLNNTGSVARTFRVDLIPATGGSASETSSTFGGPLSVTGLTIAPGETKVMAVGDLFPAASFTGPARGTVRIRAEAPRGQMNGLYQIVNPASGSISNHVMVQSGTN
ncbi:MAG: hypothetical protein KatS3mg127_1536 [Silanimonas sp.]|nr:MAG: hypothetical protein KatS3mg127_1536 [Silanimonas sp.]